MWNNSKSNIDCSFGQFFKFLRLSCGFPTLSGLTTKLEKAGVLLHPSLLSHWQRGSRMPTSRKTLVKIIELFRKNSSDLCLSQANTLLSLAKKTKLSDLEIEKLELKKLESKTWVHTFKNFIAQEKTSQKNQSPRNCRKSQKIYRYSLSLSVEEHQILSDFSKKNHLSKADFLRKMINEHQSPGEYW